MVQERRRKLLFIFSAVVLLILIWASAPLWLAGIGKSLVVDETLRPVDVIIVLSGDDEGQRLRHAFHLYQQGYAQKILLSGGTNLLEETGVDLMERYLIQLGISAEHVLSEKRSESTAENASFSKHLMEERGLRSAIVVTSPTHSRRVSLIFKRVFSPPYTVSVSSDPKAFQPEEWWRDPSRRRTVIREFFQMGWFLLFGD